MVGDKEGFVVLLVKYLHSFGHQQDVKCFHGLGHQEALFAKSVTSMEVMIVIIGAVNFGCTHALSHRQFHILLDDAEAEFSNMIYFCEVRWLSRGKMLARFFNLRDELVSFLREKSNSVPQFEDPAWVCDLGFLVDITGHLNEVNIQLQGGLALSFIVRVHIILRAAVQPHEADEEQDESTAYRRSSSRLSPPGILVHQARH
ncbi:general transcription factor II-I repeat domain-containing protein 2-like [Octopus bimaculoides]|uniref:general transcription factor II-I repeat domain-containing protein 2-like n=1 Tax=Octopus bimaculoides TaxID=37653 RepID=UPI00071CB4A7|nr:general transcription factor II-I repeat domain-containing protein 2-like [Octopus bimaculoides]|eukprot:XP_014775527.1 PREDICTED: general transcription factor II-I repeat domain-containing protein 2-like [Octopus bimaculoides]